MSHKTGGDPGSAFQASGGGFSHLFRTPSYQNGVPGIGSMRGIPSARSAGLGPLARQEFLRSQLEVS